MKSDQRHEMGLAREVLVFEVDEVRKLHPGKVEECVFIEDSMSLLECTAGRRQGIHNPLIQADMTGLSAFRSEGCLPPCS